MGAKQALELRVSGDVGALAKKGYPTLSRYPEVETHHQIESF